jgi:type IV pilus assembly protein PilB
MDLRISTLPTIHGEKMVMRILDKTILGYDFKQLGVEPEDVGRFEEAMETPYGMILLTGPTSSGKTTTLYTILNQLNSSRDNLITVEDPVEYQIRGINQMQVRPDIGLTWELGLRAILRQDPDTIMIGEIRDLESIEMAIKSALTGHLVLSTIHTNSACATISRLINMGAEPFLITASLVLVVSQRLIRTVCPQCKESFKPTQELLDRAGITGAEAKNIVFYRGTGCDYCRKSGYRGRVAIFEVLTFNRHLKELILEGATPPILEETAKKELGFRSMGEIALSKAKKGITSLEEAISLTIAEEK